MDLLNELETAKQRLEEEVEKVTAALEREEKLRKELEVLNSKLLSEKTNLLQSLEGEKGSLSSIQERAAKLAAQKSDLESQLAVSFTIFSTLLQSFYLKYLFQLRIKAIFN